MHRSLSGSPGDWAITPRERDQTDASALHAAETSLPYEIHLKANGCGFRISLKIVMNGYFNRTCEEHYNCVTPYSGQGFNKYIIRTASSRLQSEDPQMTCNRLPQSVPLMHIALKSLAEITSSDSDLIKQCCACSLIIWNKDILCFSQWIEISKQNCVWLFFSEFCESISLQHFSHR